jgi:hypothetical protein
MNNTGKKIPCRLRAPLSNNLVIQFTAFRRKSIALGIRGAPCQGKRESGKAQNTPFGTFIANTPEKAINTPLCRSALQMVCKVAPHSDFASAGNPRKTLFKP